MESISPVSLVLYGLAVLVTAIFGIRAMNSLFDA